MTSPAGPDSGRWTHDLFEHQNSIDARLGSDNRSSRQPPAYASYSSSSSSRAPAGNAAAPRRTDIQTRLGPGRSTDASGSRVTASTERSAGVASTGAKLVIENLHFEVTETDLKELFEPFNISAAHIHYDQTDRSLGRALLTFPTRTDADAARDKYNGMLLDDKPMALRNVDASLDATLLRVAAPKRAAPAFADRDQRGAGGRWEQRGQQQRAGRDREYQQSVGARREEGGGGRWQQKGGAFDLRQELGFRTKDLRRDAATRSRSRSRSRSRDRRPSSRNRDTRRGGGRNSSRSRSPARRRSRSRSRSRDRRDRPKFTFVPDSDTAAKKPVFAFVEEPRRYTRRAGDDVEDGELDEGEVYVSASLVRREERGRGPAAARDGGAEAARTSRGRGERRDRDVRGRDADAMDID